MILAIYEELTLNLWVLLVRESGIKTQLKNWI